MALKNRVHVPVSSMLEGSKSIYYETSRSLTATGAPSMDARQLIEVNGRGSPRIPSSTFPCPSPVYTHHLLLPKSTPQQFLPGVRSALPTAMVQPHASLLENLPRMGTSPGIYALCSDGVALPFFDRCLRFDLPRFSLHPCFSERCWAAYVDLALS